MNWILDVLAILLVFGLGFIGWRRGFFNSTINLFLVIIVIEYDIIAHILICSEDESSGNRLKREGYGAVEVGCSLIG